MAEINSVGELETQLRALLDNPKLNDPMAGHFESWPSSDAWPGGIPKHAVLELPEELTGMEGRTGSLVLSIDGQEHVLMHDMANPGQFVLLDYEQVQALHDEFIAPFVQTVDGDTLNDPAVRGLYDEITDAIADQPMMLDWQISADLIEQSGMIRISDIRTVEVVPEVEYDAAAALIEEREADRALPEPVEPDIVFEDPNADLDVALVDSVPEVDFVEAPSIDEVLSGIGVNLPTEGEMSSQAILSENRLYEAARNIFFTVQADGAMSADAFERYDEIVEAFETLEGGNNQYSGILAQAYDAMYDDSGVYRNDADWAKIGELQAQLDQTFANRVQAAVNPVAKPVESAPAPEAVPVP